MSRRARIGGLKGKNIETALLAEEQALTTVHVAVTKQLRRLEAEEQLLQEILRRAEQEGAEQQGGEGQQPSAQPAHRQEQQQRDQRQQQRHAQQQQQQQQQSVEGEEGDAD
ncbi:hypothetical protein C2E21_7228 [Chlorella sorokiniana]|uniref:Uncharacterized protein n=1 Tax=Chlorella sorokiniana TaxID=3076 RepID=A0A2P6TI20_CHLSO|nr:hypothetical protein C2E21_7228 [Chlorella sorokiniana]|eukprot:PRW33945.1 hypothetical protein C2E21_7228 [Chlorella sorokiniana]